MKSKQRIDQGRFSRAIWAEKSNRFSGELSVQAVEH
jgi:hypothetical protein